MADPADTATLEVGPSPAERAALAKLRSRMLDEQSERVQVGRYVLRERLGSGASGTVWSAHDPQLDRVVAIKLLKARGFSRRRPEEATARLAREAQAIAALSHPNIVAVYDVGRTDDGLFIAMERIRGGTLRAWIDERRERQPLDWRAVLAMLIQAGRGLAAANERGLIHRDFKPDNVMITEGGVAKVLDFGLARISQRESASDTPAAEVVDSADGLLDSGRSSAGGEAMLRSLTETGTVMGTPRYMAPEQHLGETLGVAADQFAFCVTLFEALYGCRPHAGSDLREVARAKRHESIRPPPTDTPVPTRVHAIVRRGLSSDPAARYPTLTHLLDALEADPSRRRRRLGAVAAGVLVVSGTAAALAVDPSEDPCAGASDRIDAVWNAARRAELEAGFGASDVSGATAAWSRVDAQFDEFFARWRSEYRSACEGGEDAQARDSRMACLNERLREANATLGVLEAPDEDIVRNAVAATSSATRSVECSGRDVGARTEVDPAHAAEIDAQWDTLARAVALENAGKYQSAIALARGVITEAERLGALRLEASAYHHVASALANDGRHQEARDAYAAAYFRSNDIGYSEVQFGAAARLARLLAADLDSAEEAETWLRHAEAVYPIGVRSNSQEAVYFRVRAAIHRARGNAQDSILDMVASLALREADQGSEAFETAGTRYNLASYLAELGRFAEAVDEFERASAGWEKSLGPDHPDLAMVLDALASTKAQLGEHAEAVELHQRALDIAVASLGADNLLVANIENNLGVALGFVGRFEDSERHLARALDGYLATVGDEHPNYARGLINLGLTYSESGRPDEALQKYQRAEGLLERSMGSEHPLVWVCRVNIADMLRVVGRHDEAIVEARAATEKIGEGLGKSNYYAAAATTLGHALVDARQFGEAVTVLEEALALRNEFPAHPRHAAELEFCLAEALVGTGGDLARARALAAKARTRYDDDDPMSAEIAEIDAWLAAHPPT